MYYINSFFLYSLLGFIVESTIFKNTILKPSGVLNGPITLVYGVGGIVLLIVNKYIIDKIKTKKNNKNNNIIHNIYHSPNASRTNMWISMSSHI